MCCGNRTRAAEMAGIDRKTHYDWLQDDPEYPARFAKAMEQAGDALEDVAFDRAMGGDTTLVIFLLKGAKPEKYRERVQNDVNLKGDLTIEQRLAAAKARMAPKE